MAGTLPHAFHFGMRKLLDEEEYGTKIRKKLPQRKKTEETLKINHAQPETVQLPEAYQTGDHKEFQCVNADFVHAGSRKSLVVSLRVKHFSRIINLTRNQS